MIILKYALILIGMHLTGSAILFGIVSGPLAILGAPVLGLFGWYFIVPEALAVIILASLYEPVENQPRLTTLKIWMPLAITGAVIVGLLCPKEQSKEVFYWLAGSLAGFGATTFTFFCIHRLKLKITNREMKAKDLSPI